MYTYKGIIGIIDAVISYINKEDILMLEYFGIINLG